MVLIFTRPVHQQSSASVGHPDCFCCLSVCLSVCLSAPESAVPCPGWPVSQSVNQIINQSICCSRAQLTGARTHLDRPIPVPVRVPILVHTLGTLHCNCDPSVPYLPTAYLPTT